MRKKINKHWSIGRRTESAHEQRQPNGTRDVGRMQAERATGLRYWVRRRRRRCCFACAVHGGGGRLWAAPGRRPITTLRRFPLSRRDDNQSLFFSFFALPLLFLFTPSRRRHRRRPIRAILRFLLFPPSLDRRRDNYSLFNFFSERTIIIQRCRVLWFYGRGYAKTRCYRAIRKCCRRHALLCRTVVVLVTRKRSRGVRLHEGRGRRFFPVSVIRTMSQDDSWKTKKIAIVDHGLIMTSVKNITKL